MNSLETTIRSLAKARGFSLIVVLILAFGIGVNTAMFSLIDAVLLRPLSFPNSDRLVQIGMPQFNNHFLQCDYPDYVDIRTSQRTFEAVGCVHDDGVSMISGGVAERLQAEFISPSMLEVSGLAPLIGRWFTESEDVPNGPLVVVLSERLWKSHFQSDPNIIGTSVTLNDQSFQVIGVLGELASNWGPIDVDVYFPVHMIVPFGYVRADRGDPLSLRDVHAYRCFGRLKANVSLAQAQADLDVIHADLVDRYPDTNKGYGMRLYPLLDRMVRDYSVPIWLLGSAALCFLLLSCVNVANLFLARGLERLREITIRAALGSGRKDLVIHLLVEPIVLSVIGGTAGFFIALWLVQATKTILPMQIFRFQEIRIDLHALFFVFGVTTVAALCSGALPAWSLSRADVGCLLRGSGDRLATPGKNARRLKSALIVGQVALACVLFVNTGLVVRSLAAAQAVPLGFNPHHVFTAAISLYSPKYQLDGVQTRKFWDALFAKIREIPGVKEAAFNSAPPNEVGGIWKSWFLSQ